VLSWREPRGRAARELDRFRGSRRARPRLRCRIEPSRAHSRSARADASTPAALSTTMHASIAAASSRAALPPRSFGRRRVASPARTRVGVVRVVVAASVDVASSTSSSSSSSARRSRAVVVATRAAGSDSEASSNAAAASLASSADDASRDDAASTTPTTALIAATVAFAAALSSPADALAAAASASSSSPSELATVAAAFGGFHPGEWLTASWAAVAGALASPEAKELWMYTLKTLISWGVPAAVVGVVAFAVIASSRRGKDGVGDEKRGGGGGVFGFLGGKGGGSGAEPSPFVIKRLNDKLDSYAYAFGEATGGAEAVEIARKRESFGKKYASTLGRLTVKERDAIDRATSTWARKDAALRAEMASAARRMRADAARAANKGRSDSDADADESLTPLDDFPLLDEVEDEIERAALADARAFADAADAEAMTKSTDEDDDESRRIASDGGFGFKMPKLPSLPGGGAAKKLAALAAKRADAEAEYVKAVSAALPSHKRARLAKLLSDPRMSPGWEGDRDPLVVPEARLAQRDKPHVFVLQFFGDVRASQAANLREEVTAVLRNAKRSRADEGAFYTLVPIRPRSRGERRSLRTLPGASLRPHLAVNPRPRRLSTPPDAFQLHPDIALYGTTRSRPRPQHRRRDRHRLRPRRRAAHADSRRGHQADDLCRASRRVGWVHDGVRRGSPRRVAVRRAREHRRHLGGAEPVRAPEEGGDRVPGAFSTKNFSPIARFQHLIAPPFN